MTRTYGPFTVECMPRWRTMADIKQSNKDAGFHFFDKATLRFFDSIIHRRKPYAGPGGVYFVTSERLHGVRESEPRMYTVRRFDIETADVHTAGAFNSIRHIEDARKAARRLARGK